MRAALLTLAATCLVAPVPALAAGPDTETSAIASELTDPARQAEIAAMLETMTNLMLEMPAAPFLRAAATMAGEDPAAVDESATIGDLAGPEAAAAPREFAHRLPQMMSAMAVMAAAFEDMAPLLRERLEQTLPPETH